MDKIAIIILNWNQPKLTVQTIKSLKNIYKSKFNYHIFLLDSNSTDNSVEIFNKLYRQNKLITIIKLKQNYGFSGGNNFGIKEAIKNGYNYVLLLNNDTVVDKYFLHHLLLTLKNNTNIGIVGPKIYFAPGYEFHRERYSKNEIGKVIWSVGGFIDWNNLIFTNRGIDEVDKGQYNKETSNIDKVSGCCALIPTNIFKNIGLLDDRLYLYNEDDDFCQRVKQSGHLVYIQPKSVIWHLNSGSSKSGGGVLHDYFMTRNRLIFGFRYASLRTKFALFRDSIRILINGYPWQKTGVIDFYINRLGKGSWK